ncbi:MAG TPA: hypothetical protein VJZ69_02485 [Clostridia bacterium]|nr:hypothetical protein [Clostridia bacterium]
MKNTIKKIALCVIAVILIIGTCAFTACNATNSDLKTVTVTIGQTPYTIDTNAEYLHNALLELKAKGELETYIFLESAYGVEITAISNLDLSNEHSFIAIYHNIDDATLIDYSEYAGKSIELSGVVYHSSGLGASALPLYDGANYLLTVSSW